MTIVSCVNFIFTRIYIFNLFVFKKMLDKLGNNKTGISILSLSLFKNQ